MRVWLISINFCLWNSGKCLKACVCVCEILDLLLFPQAHFVPEAESGPDWLSFRLSLRVAPHPLPAGRWSHAWPARLAWTTPRPTYLLLTCTVLSDTFVGTHTHTHTHMQLHASLCRKREFERAGSPAQWPFICSAVCVRRADDWLLCH